MAGRSELGLELASIVFQGKTYNVVSSDVKQTGTSRGKQTAERVGGGAALGALIGAIAGGGKGAAIGAALGGGAGTGAQILTHGQQVKIPSETRLDFTLQHPLEITYVPGKKSRQRLRAEQVAVEKRGNEKRKADMHRLASEFEQEVGNIVNTVSSASNEL